MERIVVFKSDGQYFPVFSSGGGEAPFTPSKESIVFTVNAPTREKAVKETVRLANELGICIENLSRKNGKKR